MIEQIKSDTMTAESIQAFRRFLENDEKSLHTVNQYVHDVENFFKFLPKDKKLDKEIVIQYKAKLIEQYGKPVTVNTKLCAINKYLAFMNLHHFRVKSVKVQRSMFRDAGRELTRTEYIRLLNVAKQKKDRRLFLVMETICATGIRVSELRYVTVQGVKRNYVEVTAKGKTRRIFLPKKLRTDLLLYIKEKGLKNGPVFVTRTGKPLDRSNIWHEMKAICAEAHVAPGKVFPHNLRHLFARCFYEANKNLAHLADILGHSSVETTRLYTIRSDRAFARTLDSLMLLI